jgi:hypothetical protein
MTLKELMNWKSTDINQVTPSNREGTQELRNVTKTKPQTVRIP